MQPPRKLLAQWNEGLRRLGHNSQWTTGLIILSSAVLGGIAVALWNRKALAAFREFDGSEVPGLETQEQLRLELEDDLF